MRAVPILVAVVFACGCGSSDELPTVEDSGVDAEVEVDSGEVDAGPDAELPCGRGFDRLCF